MRKSILRAVASICFLSFFNLGSAVAEDNHIDTIRSDAPELAKYGKFNVGFKTLKVTNPMQLDIVKFKAGAPMPLYDRPLTLEVWYPAQLAPGQLPAGQY